MNKVRIVIHITVEIVLFGVERLKPRGPLKYLLHFKLDNCCTCVQFFLDSFSTVVSGWLKLKVNLDLVHSKHVIAMPVRSYDCKEKSRRSHKQFFISYRYEMSQKVKNRMNFMPASACSRLFVCTFSFYTNFVIKSEIIGIREFNSTRVVEGRVRLEQNAFVVRVIVYCANFDC